MFLCCKEMNGVLRPIDNSGHIGHAYISNTDANWK